jgi:hypothetical protein
LIFGKVPKLSLWQRFVLKVSGAVFVGYRQPAGYRGAVPVYVVRCSRHGLYLDYPHGYSGRFQCCECLLEPKFSQVLESAVGLEVS